MSRTRGQKDRDYYLTRLVVMSIEMHPKSWCLQHITHVAIAPSGNLCTPDTCLPL